MREGGGDSGEREAGRGERGEGSERNQWAVWNRRSARLARGPPAHLKACTGPTSAKMSCRRSSVASYGTLPTNTLNGGPPIRAVCSRAVPRSLRPPAVVGWEACFPSRKSIDHADSRRRRRRGYQPSAATGATAVVISASAGKNTRQLGARLCMYAPPRLPISGFGGDPSGKSQLASAAFWSRPAPTLQLPCAFRPLLFSTNQTLRSAAGEATTTRNGHPTQRGTGLVLAAASSPVRGQREGRKDG
jgi:hypothetical protein